MPNKLRKCTGCKDRFPAESMISIPAGWFHSFDCATQLAVTRRNRAAARKKAKVIRDANEERKAYDRTTKEMKLAIMTARDWIKKLQPIYNKYIRLRDRYQNCISCGRTNGDVEITDGWKPGGAWDCGHFLSVGSHPELRFEPRNAHKQCKACNGGSGQYTKKNFTVGKEYRERLIIRIGLDTVEWLEGPHEKKKYTVDQLKAEWKIYSHLVKKLKKRSLHND